MTEKLNQGEIIEIVFPSTSFFGVFLDEYTFRSLFYILFIFPISIASFVYTITMTALSLGLMITIFGLPLAYIFMLSLPRVMSMKGALAQEFTGVQMPILKHDIPEGNIFQKSFNLITRPVTLLGILYGIIILPLGIFYFVYTVTFLITSSAMTLAILYPIVKGILRFSGVEVSDNIQSSLGDFLPEWVILISLSVIGLFLLTFTLHSIREIAKFDAKLIRSILTKAISL